MTAPLNDALDLGWRISEARRIVDRRTGERDSLEKTIADISTQIEELENKSQLYQKVSALLTSISEAQQNTLQRRLETLVTQGLHTIFGDSLSFRVVNEVKANAVNIDFLVVSHMPDGTEVVTPVLEARGGGVAAVVGFLVRLVLLMLSGPKTTKILLLDETFSHVSQEYETRLADFIKEVVDNTDVQIVLVTHSNAFTDAADTVYFFSNRNGKTQIKDNS